jgi:hypothetical protein
LSQMMRMENETSKRASTYRAFSSSEDAKSMAGVVSEVCYS